MNFKTKLMMNCKKFILWSLICSCFLFFSCGEHYNWSKADQKAYDELEELVDDYSEEQVYDKMGITEEQMDAYDDHTVAAPDDFVVQVALVKEELENEALAEKQQRITSFNNTVIGSLYGFMVSWKGFFVILGTYLFYLMLSFGAEARLKKVITRDYGDSCEVVDEDDMMGVFPLIIVVVYLIVVVVRFFSV